MFGLTHAEFERKRCPETLEKMNRYPGTVDGIGCEAINKGVQHVEKGLRKSPGDCQH